MNLDRKSFLRQLGLGAMGLAAGGTAAGAADLPAFSDRDPERFWAAVRAQYLLTPGFSYLNTGGLGPAAGPVLDVYEKTSRHLQEKSETGHALFTQARTVLARFLGAEVSEISFVRNATEGNGIVAAGLALKAGDEVIFDSHAHPGGAFPWINQHKQRGVVVRTFEPDVTDAAGNLARIAALITPRTRVVQVSHVTAPTGIVMPAAAIAKLCHERGIWFHIDGAQSAGMFPFELRALGCDSFATSGHKWIGGPHETGVLFIRREKLDAVAPVMVGAYSTDQGDLSLELPYVNGTVRHEYGTRNAAAVVALAAAAETQERIGRARIAARGRALAARVRTGLARLPDLEILTPANAEINASILTFRSPRIAYDKLFERLLTDHRLRCRPVSEQQLNAVRVSLHLCNGPDECDRLVEAMAAILKKT
ncbi:MAG: aminotransferase class V-fold PLP-dependent enzyme [Verrucomicrobia bacterium]|nr:aminotransferase class V-fold PLP-dependent enzyme [Verrucomicrobiota bacterium]